MKLFIIGAGRSSNHCPCYSSTRNCKL